VFEEILSQRKIFTLRFDSQRKTRLALIVHCRHACVPSHVPRRHVPKQEHPGLQRCDVAKQ
jgi:hypothetical protein